MVLGGDHRQGVGLVAPFLEIETGDLADQVLAAEVEAEHPLRGHSREAPLAEWLLQTFAPILHRELAPQSWPEGGIIAVDSVKMNLLGRHKYVDAEGNDLDDYRERDEEGNLLMPPEGVFQIDIPDVEKTRPDVFDLLDEDDQEDRDALSLAAYVPEPPDTRPGLQGGVPCWEVLGAYGYERAKSGVFPRGEELGRIWLLRSYFKPNSLAWAHFFRQLEGTPAYVICDMAPAIRVGVELAWPDEKTRPQILVCEHHVIEAIKRRVAGDHRLEADASRLFRTYGRRVDGDYPGIRSQRHAWLDPPALALLGIPPSGSRSRASGARPALRHSHLAPDHESSRPEGQHSPILHGSLGERLVPVG